MGPVVVGIAAIAVSALFNFLALKRSGQNLALAEAVAERAEQRYRSDRVEARKKQLLDALLEVFRHVNAWVLTNAQYSATLQRLVITIAKHAAERDISESASAVDNHDMDKQRPALGEAHRALQVAKLLLTDTADVLPPENVLLIDAQLVFIGDVLLNAQSLVQEVSAECPGQIGSSLTNLSQSRRQVSASVGYLLKLTEALVLGDQNAVHDSPVPAGTKKPALPDVPE